MSTHSDYQEKKYETAKRLVENLGKSVDRFASIHKKRRADKEEYLEKRDSLIKRFELSFDTTWKYAKVYLEVNAGLIQNSPKSIFRECLRINILSEDDTEKALRMVDLRNQATHTYLEELAEDISEHIPEFYALMNHIIKLLKPTGIE